MALNPLLRQPCHVDECNRDGRGHRGSIRVQPCEAALPVPTGGAAASVANASRMSRAGRQRECPERGCVREGVISRPQQTWRVCAPVLRAWMPCMFSWRWQRRCESRALPLLLCPALLVLLFLFERGVGEVVDFVTSKGRALLHCTLRKRGGVTLLSAAQPNR